jgi:SAM-dependent methyltransferase
MNEYTRANQRGWDRLAETHFRNYHIDTLRGGTPLINDLIRAEVGPVAGKTLCHLLCHIGTDTLSWALLGARVTGIDISPESLRYARQLAAEMQIDASFIEADVMDVIDCVHEQFDIVFSSTGVLCWLPDIRRYARTVRHLLREGGIFYLFDGHPFRAVQLDDDGEYGPAGSLQGDYFRRQVWHYPALGDYTDPDLVVAADSYEWHWTMGDIISALCEAGLRIEFLHEFPRYFYNGYTPYDVPAADAPERFPCTFSLRARAD